MKYLNMYLMSEGFIYILFGVLYITFVIKYSKNTRIFYILIPLGLIPFIKQAIVSRNVTLVASIGLSLIVYLILRRKWLYASILANLGLILAFLNWPLIQVKWPARPFVWRQLVKEIAKHPWIGSGWNKFIGPPDNMIWVEGQNWGWLWKHNDWLSLADYLGIPALILISWFFIASAKKIGIRPALIPLLTIGIMSFFQFNFFRVERAPIYLLTIGLCIRRSLD